MSSGDTCVAPRYSNGLTTGCRITGAEAFELEGMDPCYIDIDGFWLRDADTKCPESAPIANEEYARLEMGGELAASPIVAWNRRALCSSLYAGKAVGSPTLQ